MRDLDTIDSELRLLTRCAALSASTAASRQVVTSTNCSTSATICPEANCSASVHGTAKVTF